MKIFLISNMYPSIKHPGYGVFVKNAVEGMIPHGIEVKYSSYIQDQGSSILKKLFKYLSFYWNIFIHYFKHYDCIYLHFPILATPVVYPLMLLKKRPLVINYHGEDLLYQKYGKLMVFLGKLTDRMVKKYATFIVVPSNYYREIVIERGLASGEHVFTSPSGGINPAFILQETHSKQPDKPIHLGFVGRLEEDKGVLNFIEAAQKLLETSNKYCFTIIGYGSLNSKVLDLTKEKPEFQVIFGAEQKELVSYYNQFDLLVFPSRRESESLGLVGIEAMACGAPVIGSNMKGISSYLKDNYNGFLISVENPVESIVEAVKKYIELPEYSKETLISNALKTAQQYRQEIVCENLAFEFKKRIN